jgi:DNA polymerase (family 10)
MQSDLRVVANHEFPFALAYFTGSKEHNVALRGRALRNGWTLNEYRLGPEPSAKQPPKPIPAIDTEADLYTALALNFVVPELREATGEIEAAEAAKLPKLVELSNLRGTFHAHTSSTDGSRRTRSRAAIPRNVGS